MGRAISLLLYGYWASGNCAAKTIPATQRKDALLMYNCVASSVEGFVQQLAVGYVSRGYYFYVLGRVPDDKDPELVDQKLITKYGITSSKATRARRKAAGQANIQLLRYRNFFVIVATPGKHELFREEQKSIRDSREEPIKFGPYSISYRNGHVHVRIAREEYRDLKALMLSLAARRSVEELESEFRALPYEPFAPVKRQLFVLLRAVNAKRKNARLSPLPFTCLRLQRRTVRVFAHLEAPIGRGPKQFHAHT